MINWGSAFIMADLENLLRQYGGAANYTTPEGVGVTPEQAEEMEARRVANLCLDASAAGWQVRLRSHRSGYCAEWRGPNGELVTGPGWESTPRRALLAGVTSVAAKLAEPEPERVRVRV